MSTRMPIFAPFEQRFLTHRICYANRYVAHMLREEADARQEEAFNQEIISAGWPTCFSEKNRLLIVVCVSV